MIDTTQYLSQDKLEKLQEEYKQLKEVRIPELANLIDEAKQLGDLSENAEYHQAREDMSWAQGRAKEIVRILDHAEVVSSSLSSDSVNVGSKILVSVNGKEREYTIVGAQEADPAKGCISNESPLGSAFVGKKKGDSVELTVPAGVQTYLLKKIF